MIVIYRSGDTLWAEDTAATDDTGELPHTCSTGTFVDITPGYEYELVSPQVEPPKKRKQRKPRSSLPPCYTGRQRRHNDRIAARNQWRGERT